MRQTTRSSIDPTTSYRELQQRRYLSHFAQWHYPWLVEIGRRWKQRGEWAFDRFALMDYYTEGEDVEVAAYVSLMTQDNARLHDQVTELHHIIGDCPWDWVENRVFITLSTPDVASERIIGTNRTKGDLFNLLDWVWGLYFDRDEKRPALSDILKVQDEQYMMAMLNMRLTKHDGIGRGVRPYDGEEMPCPVNHDMLRLIRKFYPRHGRYGLQVTQVNANDVLQFMGFDDPTDFVYAYQGYQRMAELMPKAMERNERLFMSRYMQGFPMDESGNHFRVIMTEMLPEIKFD